MKKDVGTHRFKECMACRFPFHRARILHASRLHEPERCQEQHAESEKTDEATCPMPVRGTRGRGNEPEQGAEPRTAPVGGNSRQRRLQQGTRQPAYASHRP